LQIQEAQTFQAELDKIGVAQEEAIMQVTTASRFLASHSNSGFPVIMNIKSEYRMVLDTMLELSKMASPFAATTG
jgi:hypothetical protein